MQMPQKSLSPRRGSDVGGSSQHNSDLEARIAQLDARLRQAREENDMARSKVSPSPRIPYPSAASQPRRDGSVAAAAAAPSTRAADFVDTPSSAASTAVLMRQSTSALKPGRPGDVEYRRQASPPYRVNFEPSRRTSPPSTERAVGRAPIMLAASPPRRSGSSPRGTVTSPWRAVAQRTNAAQEREAAVTSTRHASMANAIAGQIAETHEELQAVNAAAYRTDAIIAGEQRQRDVAVAESTRQVQTAEERLRELEKVRDVNNDTIQELQLRKTALQRQLEETKLGITGAQARVSELDKQQMGLEGRVKEVTAALRERERAITEENDQSALLRRRLDSRLAALEEEVQQAADRLRRLEASHNGQETKWKEEESALLKQNDDTSALLAEMSTRRQLLQEEIADREEEAIRQRDARRHKAEAMIAARLAERERDLEASKREMDQQSQQLEQERFEAVQELNSQLDSLRRQTESKRRAKEAQEELNNELELKVASLKGELDQKQLLHQRCMAAEEQLSGLQRQHGENETEIYRLNEELQSKDQEVVELQNISKRLAMRQEEERRLRTHVAELAREVTDTQASIEAEQALAEHRERERQTEVEALQAELRTADSELQRIKDAGAAELDSLSRRCVGLRSDVADKEALLNNAVNEHAAKQAAIAQFEEEKRRIDREQLARKAAAAQAAKAALSELNY